MQGHYFEDLSVGQTASMTRTASDAAIRAFAEVSGDANPLHLDEAYAAKTAFGGRVAHGMLTGAYISAVLGTKLPGPGAVYVSQTLRFRRPVRVGDEVTAHATVTALEARRGLVTFATRCEVNSKVVAEGEATIVVPKRPAQA